MAIKKRGKLWSIYFRPMQGQKKPVWVSTGSHLKSVAESLERAILTACRAGDYRSLSTEARAVCLQMFRNQHWEVPHDLSGEDPVTEELTLWKSIELTLKYPEVRDSPNRDRTEQAFAHVLKHFGKDRQVKSIWIPEIKQYQSARRESGAAASTINKERAALSRMFQVLIELRHIDVNPARLAKPLSEKSAKRQVYIAFDDFRSILDCVPAWFRSICETAYYAGMRRGEILGLTRKQVNLDRRMIVLGPGYVKERDWKRVPIHRDLVPILKRVIRVAPMGSQSVFHRDGQPINHKDQVRWCWDRKVIKADLDPFPHFHDLRHTWKTNARRSGVHPEIEKAIMGHADRGKTVHEGYGRISDLELVQAMDQMTFDHGPTEILVAGYK